MNVRRFGKVIGLRAEKREEYLRLHRNVWPEVETVMGKNHMQNFTVFVRRLAEGKEYLFCYFEYVGEDYEGDMKKIAAEAVTQKWWKLTEPCQEPLADRAPGEWSSAMEEVVHHL